MYVVVNINNACRLVYVEAYVPLVGTSTREILVVHLWASPNYS